MARAMPVATEARFSGLGPEGDDRLALRPAALASIERGLRAHTAGPLRFAGRVRRHPLPRIHSVLRPGDAPRFRDGRQLPPVLEARFDIADPPAPPGCGLLFRRLFAAEGGCGRR